MEVTVINTSSTSADDVAHSATSKRASQSLLLGLAVGLAGIIALVGFLVLSPERQPLPVLYAAPTFAWKDHEQRSISNDTLRGKVVVANFIYTNCTDICPVLLTPRMRAIYDALREDELLDSRVKLVSFSVDPAHDTPEMLADYARRFGVQEPGWHFVTSSPAGDEEVYRVVVEGFKMGVQHLPVSEGTATHSSAGTDSPDLIVHSGRFVLIDSQQRVRALYDPENLEIATVLADVRRLLSERDG